MHILDEGAICSHCLGRIFAKLSTRLTNKERGDAIKLVLSMQADLERLETGETTLLEKLAPSSKYARALLERGGEDETCWVCNGLFNEVDTWAERVLQALSTIEYNTFLIGTKLTGLLIENEEILWSETKTTHAEPLKTELNREVGKIIEERTGKKADLKKPEVVALLNLEEKNVQIEIRPLFLKGRYRKLIRGIPQTRWPCRECRGEGCNACNHTGKQYPESVDELISAPIITTYQAEDTVFHGAGREDIDALMLGDGRPFIIEIKQPKKRSINLEQLQRDINTQAGGKVEVLQLTPVDGREVEKLKQAHANKTYRLKAILEKNINEETLKSSINQLKGTITQQTPTRVLHRRADRPRRRQVHEVQIEHFDEDNNTVTLTIRCEGGLYVKELISGDEGRTAPSLAEALGTGAKVAELDVIKVEL